MYLLYSLGLQISYDHVHHVMPKADNIRCQPFLCDCKESGCQSFLHSPRG
jgi:hypothetical protein